MIVQVSLTLCKVWLTTDRDPGALQRVLEEHLHQIFHLNSCFEASEWLDGSPTPVDRSQDVQKFVKVQDRFLSLVSFLLKSRAFHQTHGNSGSSRLPIVNLPRTKHRKPFIPPRIPSNVVMPDENVFPLSVSHQYPFAGCARLLSPPQGTRVLVGLDIVVFDEYNRRLYQSVLEFCRVFRGSFAATEMARIEHAGDDGAILRELYLRWAIKEAYTKALGVGLGFEFQSFETRLEVDSLWHAIASGERIQLVGGVVQMVASSQRARNERWVFEFIPLFLDDTDRTAESMAGCACVGIGPVAHAAASHLTIDWVDVQGLVEWHADPQR